MFMTDAIEFKTRFEEYYGIMNEVSKHPSTDIYLKVNKIFD